MCAYECNGNYNLIATTSVLIVMSEEASLPRFPIPFWDKDTVMCAGTFPADMDVMVMAEPRTILERNLDRFTQAVREKARWWEKVHTPGVIERWRFEAALQNVEEHTFDFALQVRCILNTCAQRFCADFASACASET